MLKTLAIKELRESVGLLALAALGMTWTITRLMGSNLLGGLLGSVYGDELNFFAFLNDDFFQMACIFVGGLAIGLGLKQSAWEHGKGTYFFLFHRPIPRWQVLVAKLAVGLFLIVALLSISIGWYGWRASIPGKKPVPFDWGMTIDSWLLGLTLPLLYFGAFLSGMRPGNWFGTRLFPLAAATLWTFLCSMLPYWWLTVPMSILGYLYLLISIYYYTETRDY